MKKEKFRFSLGSRSDVFVLKKKRNINLNDLNYYQKRSLKNRLMISNLIIRDN